MKWTRLLAILTILTALAAGSWTRYVYGTSHVYGTGKALSLLEIRPQFGSSSFRVIGTFEEPLSGLTGFQISTPSCRDDLGVLPVGSSNTAITPTDYKYHPGKYVASYILNGSVYSERFISYRLAFLYELYRVESFFGLVSAWQSAYYLKVWVPSECSGISTSEAYFLEKAFIYPIRDKL